MAHGAAQADSGGSAPNPHLVRETGGLAPGTALDAGCGTGAEATWLAARGWQVTGADISGAALAQAAERAEGQSAPGRVTWVEADLTSWAPGGRFDLVTTHYAHPAMPQLAFYERISHWVAPGGMLEPRLAHRQRRAPGPEALVWPRKYRPCRRRRCSRSTATRRLTALLGSDQAFVSYLSVGDWWVPELRQLRRDRGCFRERRPAELPINSRSGWVKILLPRPRVEVEVHRWSFRIARRPPAAPLLSVPLQFLRSMATAVPA
ncbi:class I SAM-dependent methyltransferase [Arthrobacter sp. MW3 TE3886]|uniref:class I SAM-dependent methyltransferase n=1 Tax=Arthrobacter sp. MW3 TE3886 TaxID=3156254 RepID=UPI0035136377